jgi:fructose-1-phosphate kinase PfkB-like protein
MTEQAIDIMEPGHQVSEEELRQIASEENLREACRDILVIQGELAPKTDTETALQVLLPLL